MSTISNKLDDGIFQLLTQEPNKWIPVVTLYNMYTREFPNTYNVLKRDFMAMCEMLHTRFKNVRKYHKNGMCFLAFVTDDSVITTDVRDEEYRTELENDNAFKSLKKDDVIQYMLDNSEYCQQLSFDEYFDGNDTIMHILYRNGKPDLVDKIMTSYKINMDVKNASGESLLDVINYSDKLVSARLVKLFISNQVSKINLEHAKTMEQIRETNSSLLDKNKLLTLENNRLRNSNERNGYMNKYMMFTIMLFFMYMMMS